MTTSLAQDFLILSLNSQLKIKQVELRALKEQKNFVTTLQANVTEQVIKEIQSQLEEILSVKEKPVIDFSKSTNTAVDKIQKKSVVEFNKSTNTATIEVHTGNGVVNVPTGHVLKITNNKHTLSKLEGTNITGNPTYHISAYNGGGKNGNTSILVNLNKPTLEDFFKCYKSIIPNASVEEMNEVYIHFEDRNWKTKGKPIIDWRMSVRLYIRIHKGKQDYTDIVFEKPTREEFKNFYLSLKQETSDTEITEKYNSYEDKNWTSKYKPIRDWRAAVRGSIFSKVKTEKV